MNSLGDEEHKTFVLDAGSNTYRFGYAGDDGPRLVNLSAMMRNSENDKYSVIESYLKLKNRRDDKSVEIKPLWNYQNAEAVTEGMRGKVRGPELNADVFQTILNGGLRHINTYQSGNGNGDTENNNPEEYCGDGLSLLVTLPEWHSNIDNRCEVAKVLFESGCFNKIWFGPQGTMSLFSLGKTEGTSVRIGASGMSVVPVVDGYALSKSTIWHPVGGNFLDYANITYMASTSRLVPSLENYLLFEKYRTDTANWWCANAIHKQMKDSLMRVGTVNPLQYKNKNSACSVVARATMYELPDGSLIDMHHPMTVYLPELFFSPLAAAEELGVADAPELKGFNGIVEAVRDSVMSTDVDAREVVLHNVVISGGSTNMPGFSERLAKGLFHDQTLMRVSKPRVHQETLLSEKNFGTFIGASILGTMSSFQSLWLTIADYEELGDTLIKRANR